MTTVKDIYRLGVGVAKPSECLTFDSKGNIFLNPNVRMINHIDKRRSKPEEATIVYHNGYLVVSLLSTKVVPARRKPYSTHHLPVRFLRIRGLPCITRATVDTLYSQLQYLTEDYAQPWWISSKNMINGHSTHMAEVQHKGGPGMHQVRLVDLKTQVFKVNINKEWSIMQLL